MSNNLLSAFNGATQEEKNELIAAISGQQGAGSDVYAALKLIENERAQATATQQEYERGEKLRQESREKFNKIWAGKL